MSKLKAAARKRLPAKDFALGKGHYPIEDATHARDALSRVDAYGTPAQEAEVRRKVHAKYPGIKIKGLAKGGEVKETGLYTLSKGEKVTPAKDNKMSKSARVAAHLGSAKKDKKKKHRVKEVRVRRSDNDSYIAENHHEPDPDTGVTPPMEEHTFNDIPGVQDHIAESLGPEAAQTPEAPGPAPTPAAGA